MFHNRIFILIAFCVAITLASEENRPFDPNDCYEPGTIFEENEKNLGFCPCKYGYYGPQCFEIYQCVIGQLRMESCKKEFRNEYDLQWRCAASKKDLVKICTCPDGFRGETCEFILENTIGTYWESVKQAQKFFEIVYNREHSVVRLVASTVATKIIEYRRFLMIVIFLIILEFAWRRSKRSEKCQKSGCGRRLANFNNNQNCPPEYQLVDHTILNMEAPPPFEESNVNGNQNQIQKNLKEIQGEEDKVRRIEEIREVQQVCRPAIHV